MENLYDKLYAYSKSDFYPFHMPGHKRNLLITEFTNPFSVDITEIDGFDNLHHAEGILKHAEERAANLYGSEETHFIVNGSTCGILSAISACTKHGDKIIMARNCHKAAYHGVFLRELKTEYVYPQLEHRLGLNGGLNPEEIRDLLIKDRSIKAVFITSPTYDGIVSDVETIGKIAHEYGIPLIVDEAHGAHFGFHSYFPANSIKAGADIVIHSIHKTLPSLTQTALIHVNGKLVDREKIRKYLDIYQTSSPSYVLMASIDSCIRLIESEGDRLFSEYAARLSVLRERLKRLKYIKLADCGIRGTSRIADMDLSKLVLSVRETGLTGKQLYHILLDEYHLQMEMAAGDYVLAMTSIADTEDGFIRLVEALEDIEKKYEVELLNGVTGSSGPETDYADEKRHCLMDVTDQKKTAGGYLQSMLKNEIVMKISDAENVRMKEISITDGESEISGEYVYLYPPGIPIIVPGERISRNLIELISYYKNSGLSIEGLNDRESRKIKILE